MRLRFRMPSIIITVTFIPYASSDFCTGLLAVLQLIRYHR
jgi:hypothetical protein